MSAIGRSHDRSENDRSPDGDAGPQLRGSRTIVEAPTSETVTDTHQRPTPWRGSAAVAPAPNAADTLRPHTIWGGLAIAGTVAGLLLPVGWWLHPDPLATASFALRFAGLVFMLVASLKWRDLRLLIAVAVAGFLAIDSLSLGLDGRAGAYAASATSTITGFSVSCLLMLFWVALWRTAAGADPAGQAAARDRESLFRSVVAVSPEGIVAVDREGRVTLWGGSAELIFGYRADEVLGRTFPGVPQADFAAWKARLEELLAGAPPLRQEVQIRHRSGFPRHILVSATGIPGTNGRGGSVLGVVVDVTERRRSERALAESEEKLRALLDHSPDVILMVGRDGSIEFANRVSDETPMAELYGTSGFELAIEQDRPAFRTAVAMAFDGISGSKLEIRTVDDQVFRIRTVPLPQPEGIDSVMVIATPITVQRRSEQRLRAHEARLDALLANVASGVVVLDRAGRFLETNPTFQQLTGRSADELQSLTIREISHPEDAARSEDAVRTVFTEDGATVQYEKRYMSVGGEVWCHVSLSPLRDEYDEVEAAIGIVTDITARKRAAADLLARERLLWAVIDLVPHMIFAKDRGGRYLLANRAMSEAYGRHPKDLPGRLQAEFHPSVEQLGRFLANDRAVIDSGSPHTFTDVQFLDTEGKTRLLNATKIPLVMPGIDETAVLGVAVDVTEDRKNEIALMRLEQQFQHAQKFESLGVLAGGIAHEFNNLLGGVLGNVDLAFMEGARETGFRVYLDEIADSARRAADLAKQMLAYAGKGRIVMAPVDMNGLLKESRVLFAASVPRKAQVVYDLAEDLPLIEGDVEQLKQVAINLITNAAEALGDEPGTLTIRTSPLVCDEEYLRDTYLDEESPPGLYVQFEVRDTGCGMFPGTLERIFDPFFSTKFTGRGLGLAAVLGIVRRHRGTIKVSSEPGKGSSFQLLFPAAEPRDRAIAENHVTPESWPFGGVVLVVDDSPHILRVARRLLEADGFAVLTAADGVEGVSLFGEHRDEIDLVLLDLEMPRLDGREAFSAMRAMRADIPIIISSGYGEQDAVSRFLDAPPNGFLPKPFELKVIRTQIRDVLTKARQQS